MKTSEEMMLQFRMNKSTGLNVMKLNSPVSSWIVSRGTHEGLLTTKNPRIQWSGWKTHTQIDVGIQSRMMPHINVQAFFLDVLYMLWAYIYMDRST